MGNGLLRNTTKEGVVRLDWLDKDGYLDRKKPGTQECNHTHKTSSREMEGTVEKS